MRNSFAAELRAPTARKGRGAIGNPPPRFDRESRVAVHDGWDHGGDEDGLPPLPTTVAADTARSILTRNDSPDIPFDRSINPYRGCEHGCVYCYARPSHAYLGLSPGLDFETRLFFKPDAARLLRTELSKPNYTCRPIAMGTNTDAYQPIERSLRVTRSLLEVLQEFRHPVTIVTKSTLIRRDIDILAEMAKQHLVFVALSVTTLDRDLARRMEPRAATPQRRLETIKALSEAGIPTGVMAAPMIPALNEAELERILAAAKEAGASHAGYVLLRLPLEVKPLFQEWLDEHEPGKASHVLSLLSESRGGRLYDAEWGKRMTGTGPHAEMLRLRFELACRRLGLNRREGSPRLDTTLFHRPPQKGDQLSLF
jgi:DNA repair photolyase